MGKDLPKASARGPPKKLKSPLKPSPPTPTVATVSSVKLFGDSPGPRGPLNPNLSMVTTVTCTNKPGLPSVLPDSLPPPMELVPMDTTGVEYQLQRYQLLLKNPIF